MKYLILILCLLLNIYNLHSAGVKVYEYDNTIIGQIEKGEEEYYYFIGSFSDKEYIGYSSNGISNIKTKYFDSVIYEGAILKNKPLKPNSIKSINDKVYIGFDNSIIIKYDKDLNVLDTLKLDLPFQIIDKILEYNNTILVSCIYSGTGDYERKMFYLEDKIFRQINNLPVSLFGVFQNLYILNKNELYFYSNSRIKSGDSSELRQKVFSTKNFGKNWDSLDISIKIPNNNIRYIHKYSDDDFLLKSDFKKYPKKPTYLQDIIAITIYDDGKEQFFELDTVNTSHINAFIYVDKNVDILYGNAGFTYISKISSNVYKFDSVLFKNHVNNLKFIGSTKVISDGKRKLYFTGLSNQILEVDLDIVLTVENSINSNQALIFPNPFI